MYKDKLVEGPFGSNACYEQNFEQEGQSVTTWMCFGSGYSTSTFMSKDSDLVKNTLATSPQLYRDLMHTDKNDRVWFPATITLPGKGMVYPIGNRDDWTWESIPVRDLEEEEQKEYPIPDQEGKFFKTILD